jgi:protein-S-isoprenylcysteine O-methyltransferase Ste14
MRVYNLPIIASWLVLIAYWVLSASRAKRSVRASWPWRREIGLRVAVFALVLVALHFLRAHREFRTDLRNTINTSLIWGFLGAALCASGATLAVWARACLGTNWGMPMAEKARPELVMDGPYACIRHPIYAGLILAILGSAIGQNVLWAIPLIFVVPYFVYSSRQEEKLLTGQFPRQYTVYIKRTKMLIPFVI